VLGLPCRQDERTMLSGAPGTLKGEGAQDAGLADPLVELGRGGRDAARLPIATRDDTYTGATRSIQS